jgi:hypothetical protein
MGESGPHATPGTPNDQRARDPNAPIVVAEYIALRDEVRRRSDNQNELLLFTLAAAGALFTIGVQPDGSVAIPALLLYPVLAMYLATAWSQHDMRIVEISAYIREHIDKVMGGGWESRPPSHGARPRRGLVAPAEPGLYLMTELAAVAFGVLRIAAMPPASAPAPSVIGRFPAEAVLLIGLLVLDGAAGLRTFAVLRLYWQRRSKS